jgi:hypothetical protein
MLILKALTVTIKLINQLIIQLNKAIQIKIQRTAKNIQKHLLIKRLPLKENLKNNLQQTIKHPLN